MPKIITRNITTTVATLVELKPLEDGSFNTVETTEVVEGKLTAEQVKRLLQRKDTDRTFTVASIEHADTKYSMPLDTFLLHATHMDGENIDDLMTGDLDDPIADNFASEE